MRVLSLFDGISGTQVALKNLGITPEVYYASEIDKYAIQITQKNFINTIQIGDVCKVNGSDYKNIDLMTWGSPCQDLSVAKKDRQGLSGSRSSLFYEAVRILKEVKPKYWLMENVYSMRKEDKKNISDILGVEPTMINSSLLTAQNRKRLYWTNIPTITQPNDKKICLKDILEDKLNGNTFNGVKRIGHFNSGGQGDRIYSPMGKSVTLSANGGGRGAKTGLYDISGVIRKLTPIECERLQGFEDNYTLGISNTQRYKCLGNAFTVPVIEHILQGIIK